MKVHTISDMFELMGEKVRFIDRKGWSSPIFKVIGICSATRDEQTCLFPPQHNVVKALQRDHNIVISTGDKLFKILECGEIFDCGRVIASWAKVEVIQDERT